MNHFGIKFGYPVAKINTMKKVILFLFAIFMTTGLSAQTETLFGSGFRVGGFGGPMMNFATLNGDFAFYSGGGGGAIFDGRFFIGGFGMGLSTDHVFDLNQGNNPLDDYYAEIGMGGLWLGYIHKPTKLVHLNFSLPLGGGGLGFSSVDNSGQDANISDGFFMLNPTIGAELNVVSFMKVSLNAGYMIFTGINNSVLSASQLNSPNVMLALKFGFFAE